MELSKNSLLWKFLCLSMDGWDRRYYTQEKGMIDGCALVTYFFKSVFTVIAFTISFSVFALGIHLLSLLLYAYDSGVTPVSLLALSWWQQIPVILYGICLAVSTGIITASAFQVGRWIAQLFKFKARPSVLVQSFKAKRQSFCLNIKLK